MDEWMVRETRWPKHLSNPETEGKVRGKPQISQHDVAVTTNRRLWFWFSIYSVEGTK